MGFHLVLVRSRIPISEGEDEMIHRVFQLSTQSTVAHLFHRGCGVRISPLATHWVGKATLPSRSPFAAVSAHFLNRVASSTPVTKTRKGQTIVLSHGMEMNDEVKIQQQSEQQK
jgi:hypothetical protein